MQGNPNTNLSDLLTNYDIGNIQSIEPFEGGRRRASKWKIQSTDGTWLLKRRRAARRRLARARLAHAVQAELRKTNYPLATLQPIRHDGKTLLVIEGHLYELFHWVEGARCNGSTAAITDAGIRLADLHGLRGSFPEVTEVPVGGFHDADRVRQHLKKLDHQDIDGDKIQWRSCIDTLMLQYNRSSIEVNQYGFDHWPSSINHGDWHPGNLLFQGDQVTAVLDFDTIQIVPTVADIANGLLQFSLVASDPRPAHWPAQCDHRRLLHFWDGYCRTNPLAPNQISSLPDLMVETLIAEAVLPIAATGVFDQPHGMDFLLMIQRKVNWLIAHRESLVQALQSVQDGHSVKVAKAAG